MRERKQLVREIRQAFDGADRPEPPLVRTDRAHDPWFAELEAEFAAHGGDLDPAFFRKHIFSARHLRPDAFRWFVRSLLFEMLALPWEIYDSAPHDESPERALIHASVYWLRPNPIAALEKRTDYEDGIATRLRLAPAERLAIAHVLHLVLESPAFVRPHLPHLASQAIAWCWRDDPAATDAAERFRAEARSYSRPPADEPEVEDLVRQIERAFAETPMPPAPLLTFLDEEGADYELELTGTAWQTMQPWLISSTGVAFCWMSPSAFRYFIPAAVRAALLGVAGDANPEYHLITSVNDASYRKKSLERIRAFAPAERAAVVAFLRWRAEHSSEPDAIRQALHAWL